MQLEKGACWTLGVGGGPGGERGPTCCRAGPGWFPNRQSSPIFQLKIFNFQILKLHKSIIFGQNMPVKLKTTQTAIFGA